MTPKRALSLRIALAFHLGLAMALATSATAPAGAEILAMVNYESKSPESLKSLKLTAPMEREEGIAIMDVDPQSDRFGEILMEIPLNPDLVAHHLFYDRTHSKIYLTALAGPVLHVMDMTTFPYRLHEVPIDGCTVAEDVIFNEDNTRWYLTCMGSDRVVVGDVATDAVLGTIETPVPYPHGLAVNSAIDRILITSTVRHTDLGDAGEEVAVLTASTHDPVGTIKVSDQPSPAGVAPVELLFLPGADPALAYVTNMYGAALWALLWDDGAEQFQPMLAYDFSQVGEGVPLEMYFNDAGDRLYVTTAKPGAFHIFDIGDDPSKPVLRKTLPAGEGAHHVAFTKDWKYGFVQSALLNLPGMSDGSITVVDLESEEVVDTITTLKDRGFNPNSIVLLPEWNHMAGH